MKSVEKKKLDRVLPKGNKWRTSGEISFVFMFFYFIFYDDEKCSSIPAGMKTEHHGTLSWADDLITRVLAGWRDDDDANFALP